MPTENRSSNTEPMVSELLPCPFCKAAMRIESNRDWHRVMGDHDEECVFLDPETMMVPAVDEQRDLIVRDWNRRALPAAQYQGEPIGEVVTDHRGDFAVQLYYGPVNNATVNVGDKVYRHPPTSDGFSAEQMTAQAADGYRNGIKAAAELAEVYPELAKAIRALPLPQ
ncbi:hypothetical protein [Pseudomonas donghuensis]|uniref:Uncharacterized protein n=1 Tax=Pseudomonas donghuensis TaxID=1163398 RepID=A0AAP0X9B2_9PSED|nr:hypothetical protein [Pseudomonas donghuensis]KDN98953.2 hypothetical protein BV82_3113 [Pseudomonas donghuensis]MDF9893406.1 hypothetical protein [Pseudomonas vranovensis]